MLIPKRALRISLELRKFTLDFLSAVLSKRVLKSMQSPAWALGAVIVSAWTHLHCQEL